MNAETNGIDPKLTESSELIGHFNKIKLLESIANQIGFYGVQCGNATLMDYIERNCIGAETSTIWANSPSGMPPQFMSI